LVIYYKFLVQGNSRSNGGCRTSMLTIVGCTYFGMVQPIPSYKGKQFYLLFMSLAPMCGAYLVIYLQILVLEVIRIVDAAPPSH
jgi:hypothetical protein